MHMRTTLNIDDNLLGEASRLTGITEKTALVRMGLEALVRREAGKRLAAMGGSDPRASAAPRKRPWNRKSRSR
jgi:Arc/MetJ family transcription regulator